MNTELIFKALWLAVPVIAAGLIHIAVIRVGAFPALARIPLDRRRTFRGRRILGENKSVRGAIVMPLATIGCTVVQAAFAERFEWARELSLIDFRRVSPIFWGALTGVGYIVGELPNSFMKRQLDILPGASAAGIKGAFFWFLDQVDSLIGILLVLCLIQVPSVQFALVLVVVTLAIHPAISLLMCVLGLKSRIG